MSDFESKPPSIGLWANDNERGPVATGNSGGIRFVLWRNDKRGNDKAPDYRLVLEQAQKRDNASQGGGNQSREPDTRQDDRGGQRGGRGPDGFEDSEIPFSPEWRV